jgi:Tol biopolymer transport system component
MYRALHRSSILLLLAFSTSARAGQVELISKVDPQSVSDTGTGASETQSISADGRYVVFLSEAPNLVPGQVDSNFNTDVFLYDRVAGTTELVSRNADSPTRAGNGGSFDAAISRDGRYVVFVSTAGDLVPGQRGQFPNGNLFGNIFLYDRLTGTTELVSHASSSREQEGAGDSWEPVISADGRYVAFVSIAWNLLEEPIPIDLNIFLYDRVSGKNELVSHASSSTRHPARGFSRFASISADGRFVAFLSFAIDLVPGQRDTNDTWDVFLYDRISKQNVLVSHASSSPTATTVSGSGSRRPVISADGSTVLFDSEATNLVPGQRSTAGRSNVFLFHRPTGKTSLVSHAFSSLTTAGDGVAGTFAVSADGGTVAFTSTGRNHVSRQTEGARRTFDVFLYSRTTGRITLVSGAGGSPTTAANAPSALRGISADGNAVLLQSAATNLARGVADANGTTDVFRYDRRSGKTVLVSHGADSDTTAAGGESRGSILSANGRWVAFQSATTDLASGVKDLNETMDVFLDGGPAARELVSQRAPDLPSDTPQGASRAASISADGRFVVFTSTASHLVAGQRDTNGATDVFLRDRALGTTVLVSRSAASPSTAGNGGSYDPRLSADGRFVAFLSGATDLVASPLAPDDLADVFLYDRVTGSMAHVGDTGIFTINSLATPPVISADGSFVAFVSYASDLVPGQIDGNRSEDVFLYERASGRTTLVSRIPGSAATAGDSFSGSPAMSADGRFIAFVSVNRNDIAPNVFLHDRVTGTTTLAGRTAWAEIGRVFPVLSADGRFLAFHSTATDLVPGQTDQPGTGDIFLYDRLSGVTTLVTHAPGSPATAVGVVQDRRFPEMALSADGRFLAFKSSSPELTAGQTRDVEPDIFLFDRGSGAVTLVSPDAGSPAADHGWESPRISADGQFVAFAAQPNYRFPTEEGYFHQSVFLYDRITGETVLASPSRFDPSVAANHHASDPLLSANGTALAFTSVAGDLVPHDHNVAPVFSTDYGSNADAFVYRVTDK